MSVNLIMTIGSSKRSLLPLMKKNEDDQEANNNQRNQYDQQYVDFEERNDYGELEPVDKLVGNEKIIEESISQNEIQEQIEDKNFGQNQVQHEETEMQCELYSSNENQFLQNQLQENNESNQANDLQANQKADNLAEQKIAQNEDLISDQILDQIATHKVEQLEDQQNYLLNEKENQIELIKDFGIAIDQVNVQQQQESLNGDLSQQEFQSCSQNQSNPFQTPEKGHSPNQSIIFPLMSTIKRQKKMQNKTIKHINQKHSLEDQIDQLSIQIEEQIKIQKNEEMWNTHYLNQKELLPKFRYLFSLIASLAWTIKELHDKITKRIKNDLFIQKQYSSVMSKELAKEYEEDQ